MSGRDGEDLDEPDRLDGAPHPREQHAFFGHREAEQAFLDGIRSGRLHHAWLIGGPVGIGKATLAYRVARRLFDAKRLGADGLESLDTGQRSPAARQIAALSHPDLAVLRRAPGTDKKPPSSTIPVEAVRRAISMFSSTAAEGGYRIAIVDSAEDLTIASVNALLKVIEEPPSRSIVLIVSHAPLRVLPTIRSRCRRLLLQPLREADVRAAIGTLGTPWSDAPEDVVDEALRLGEGSVRRTLEMLDRDKVSFLTEMAGALDALPSVEPRRLLALAERVGSKAASNETFALAHDAVERWVARHLRQRADLGPARLAPLVEACEKLARSAREVDTYNLDRRPLVLALFDDLADAVRRTA